MQYSHLCTHAGDFTALTEARHGVSIVTSQRAAPSGRNRPAAFSPWQPMSVTLLSEPGEERVRERRERAGQVRRQRASGSEPFGVTIDAGTVPEFRETGLARSRPQRNVLTYGEPHPGNTMLTVDGWRLIDWDTVLVAPLERDLWTLDPGDGSILDAYAAATGTTPRPELLDLYRLCWDIKDIAYDVSRFRRPHAVSANDDKSWELLRTLVRRVGG